MPLKRANSGGRPSASQPFTQPEPEHEEFQRFMIGEAKRKFELEVKERKVHEEKGFILTSDKDFGLFSEVVATICTHKWKNFAVHPSNPIFPLVREFYSNILTGNQTFSMVRGVKVSFSAPSINMHFDLEDCVDDFNDLVESVRGVDLDRILQIVIVEKGKHGYLIGAKVFLCVQDQL